MFMKLLVTTLLLLGGIFLLYRVTSDYTFLSEGDKAANHPGESKFNVEVVSSRISSGLILLERPDVGIDAIDIHGVPDDKVLHAKKCGRIKVHRNEAGIYLFDGSGCFLDW